MTNDLDGALMIGKHIDNIDGEDSIPCFQVPMSTRRLIPVLGKARQWLLHIDDMYKLTWQGFPMLISRVTNAKH